MIKRYLLLIILFTNFAQFSKAQYCLPSFAIDCFNNPPSNNANVIDAFSTSGGVLNITNLFTGCNGFFPNNYTYNFGLTVSQIQGNPFNFTVDSDPVQTQGFSIWVDWNQDYDFDDVGEDVWTSGVVGFSFSGSINVPVDAQPGITRMRIISGFFAAPLATDYCNQSLIYGECEDYDLEVIASSACAGAPLAGTVTPAGPVTICAGQLLHLGLTGCSVTGNLIYNWEQSLTGAAPWINVVGGFGGTGPGYITPIFTGDIWYRCTITCTTSTISSTTPPLQIDITSPGYANLPYTQSFENWTNSCDIQDVPDDLHWSNIPLTGDASWRRDDEGSTANWLNSTSGFYSPSSSVGIHSARFHSYGTNFTGDLDIYLNCNTATLGNKTITFDYINDNFSGFGTDSLEVLLSDNGGFSFNTIGSYTNSPAWTNHALIINSNTANTIVRFRGHGDFLLDTDLGIDNVNVLSPCTGSPTAGIIDPVSPCLNAPFTLNLTGASVAGGINYIWESAPTPGGPWTNFITTASPYVSWTVTSSTYFRCRVQCQSSSISNVTPVIFAQLANFYTCYCVSKSETNVVQQNIGNVTLINPQNNIILNNGVAIPLLNNPSILNYYSQFLSLTPAVTLYRDSAYDMTVKAFSKVGTFGTGYSKVYIDYNKNGVFDPITENVGGGVLDAPSQLINPNFIVPTSAQLGVTGMRIVYRVGGGPSTTTPCGTYPSGETEDYLVNISLPPCNTPPNAGIATISDTITCPGYILYLSDTGHDSTYLNLSFNWQYSSNGVSFSDIPGAVANNISYTVTGESWFRFRTTCNVTSDGYSNVLHVIMNPPFSCYGQSSAIGGSADSSDVGEFSIADSTSGNVIYSYMSGGPHLLNPAAVKNRTDRTNLGAMQLYTDSTYKFILYDIMRSATHADAKVTVFIDYNNNQMYDIPQERVLSAIAGISNYYLYAYVRTPSFPAINSNTGLRIVLNNDVSANAASDNGVGTYGSGETEEYLVTFKFKQLTGVVDNLYSIENIAVYPNPTSGVLYLGLTAKETTNLTIQTLSITGALLSEKKFDNVNGSFVTEINLSNFAKGSYLMKIISSNGTYIKRIVVE